MKCKFYIIFPVFAALILCSAASFSSEDNENPQSSVEKVVIANVVSPKETQDYKVDVDVKGKLPFQEQTLDIDTQFNLKIRHKYDTRDKEGVLPLEISMIEGSMTAEGQTLSVSPSSYPKLTLLLDKEWNVSEMYGLTRKRAEEVLPGINYSNLIILFRLLGGDQPRDVGDTWDVQIALSEYGEKYKITQTLKAVEEIEGVRVAKVEQKIIPTADNKSVNAIVAVRAVAESYFALDTGKLMKSRVNCEMTFDTDKISTKQAGVRSTINIACAKPEQTNQ